MSEAEDRELKDLGWCRVEVMGHRTIIGKVREEALFGSVMLRIDVPGVEGGPGEATQYYAGGALYGVTPISETVAQDLIARMTYRPPARLELAAVGDDRGDAFDDGEEGDSPF